MCPTGRANRQIECTCNKSIFSERLSRTLAPRAFAALLTAIGLGAGLGLAPPSAQAAQLTSCPTVLLGADGNICNSSDVQVATAIAGLGDQTGYCMPGETYQVNLAGSVTMRKNNRWDIGVFIARDGKDLTVFPAGGGAEFCEVTPLPPISRQRDNPQDPGEDPVMGSFDTNGGLDQCGDIKGLQNGDTVSNVPLTVDNGTFNGPVTLTCKAGASGKLELQSLVSWNQSDPGACDPTDPLSYELTQISKCSVDTTEIEVELVGRVTIRKTATDGGLNNFGFSYTNDSVPTAQSLTNPGNPFSLQDGGEAVIWAEIGTGPATIVVDEDDLPANWQFGSISCTGDDDTAVFINGSEVTVTLEYNEADPANSQDDVVCTYTNVQLLPEVTLDKTTSTTDFTDEGDSIDYAYAVSNTGNVALAFPIVVSDDKVSVNCPADDGGAPNNGDAVLDPGETVNCSASYNVSQADIDSGSVTNLADATVEGVTSNTDTVTVNANQNPLMTVVKSSTSSAVSEPGSVSYSYLVTNTGNVTLTNILLLDDNDEDDMSCPSTSLAPGLNMTCTASHLVTQGEIDAGGNLSNTVTASSDEAPTVQDTLNIPITQSPSLLVAKSGQWNDDGSVPGVAEVGETISYTIQVTNNGNTTLTSVNVTDPLITGAPNNGTISCNGGANPIASLAPDASDTCTGTYVVTADDVNAQSRANTATATSGGTSDSDQATVALPATAGLSLEKTGSFQDDLNADGFAEAGETISYSFTVTNTGLGDANNVSVTDPLITGAPNNGVISCAGGNNPITVLAGSSSEICMASYTLTQSDVDSGQVYNLATADSDDTEPTTDDHTEILVQNIDWTITKSGVFQDESGDNLAQPDETVLYTITIANTGLVTLTSIEVTDPLVTPITCTGGNPIPSIDPGASVDCTGSYAITQAEIDAGQVMNTATGNPDETPPTIDDDTTDLPQLAAMTIVKSSATSEVVAPGPVLYSYLVTNTGNITLTGIVLDDDNDDDDLSCPATSLAPGGDMTCTATHTVTQPEIDANGSPTPDSGLLQNTVSGNATELTEPVSTSLDIPINQSPDMTVQKSSAVSEVTGPGPVTYDYLVTNLGSVTLTGIVLSDDNVDAAVDCGGVDTLDPGEDLECSAVHTVTQEELDANGSPDADSGVLFNEVTASANEVEPVSDTLSIPINYAENLTFTVTKDFTDDNPAEVTVQLTCDSGLPLQQVFNLADGEDVEFTVQNFKSGDTNCRVEEIVNPEVGYTASYLASADEGDAGDVRSEDDGCYFDDVVGGSFACDITNSTSAVSVDVHKVWNIPVAGSEVAQLANITIWCDAVIEGGQFDDATGHYFIDYIGVEGDQTLTAMVTPELPDSNCWAVESSLDSAVESSNECGDSQETAQLTVSAGVGDECTIVNTVFFEGIPTLNRFGLVLMVLLMFGVGAIGLRRFA
jgi:uncharacterized repeat protein (TIGR01451 family)